MIQITVIKSPSGCNTCEETGRIVAEATTKFPGVEIKIDLIVNGTPEASAFGVITTPVVIINQKIYSMGKPVIAEKVESWIRKELGK
ncbi:MAG TPA: thioredoxin family protein [Candidatus Ozemobacteraceae bacterium]|nr:thioredoxin family protein [Candidatus Ozemobacteraceae bacterium]